MSVQQQPKPKMAKWIDLSSYGLKLSAMRFPDGRVRIIFNGTEPGGSDWNWALSAQGFSASRSNTFLFRDGGKLDFAPFLKRFPKAVIESWPIGKIMHIVSPDNIKSKRVEVEARSRDILGVNHLGQTVYEGATGRFIKAEEGGSSLSETESKNPALFLRVANDADLALCADGFIERMVRGEVMYADDMRRFGGVVFGEPKSLESNDARLRQVQEAIEAAMQRRLEREVTEPNAAAFEMAVMLSERQPNFIYRTSTSVAKQQYSTPLPMSVIAQRILDAMPGDEVIEPTIGNGSLVSGMPAGVGITGVEIDPRRAAQVMRLRDGMEIITGDFTRIGFDKKFDKIIANPPFGGLKPTQEIEGLKISRIDHLILIRSLLARKPEGRSVYIIGADRANLIDERAGDIEGGSKYLFNWLADHYELESVVEVDGRLYEKQGAGYPVRIVVVGPRRLDAEIERLKQSGDYRIKGKLPVLRSWEQLWDHGESALHLHREKEALRQARKAIEDAAVLETEASAKLQQAGESSVAQSGTTLHANHFQAPYIPASKAGESTSMVPRNLVAPISQAFEDFEAEYGSVDEFVARKLQYAEEDITNEKYFSVEQVDAIALAIAACEKNRALINGDVTGFGKGRVAAAMLRYAMLNGNQVVFMTEKPNLFSDLWRDLDDIDSLDIARPLIINDGVEIRGQDNKRALAPTKKKEVDRLVNDFIDPIDEGYNLVFCTYSQLNRRAEQSKKVQWVIEKVCDDATLVLDESHNAAGDSNTGVNVSVAVDNAAQVMYSSATFAKNAKNMSVYSRAFPAGAVGENLADTLMAGGEPLQEVLSGMLARDGVLIRREHDLSKLEFVTHVDNKYKARNEELSDKLSEILLEMSYLSGDVDKLVIKLQKEVRKELEKLGAEQRKGNRMSVNRPNFGSRLYTIQRQALMSMKVDATVDSALKALEEGRKPIIVLEQTQEQLVRDVIAKFTGEELGEDGESDLNIASLGGKTIDLPKVTLRDVLSRTLDRLDAITERNAYGVATKTTAIAKAENDEQAKAWHRAKERIQRQIDALPDMPCSPIDIIRDRIERAGYTCGELSGRSLQLGVRDDGSMVAMQRIDDRLGVIHGFNNGDIDAMIMSRAGSTGCSLHSSEKFEDQRQREVIELQIANNVAERIQFFGRANRRGQVSSPIIRTISSDLPAEARVLAMQNAKLRKLSANTQSNRENAAESTDAVDVINSIGNKICFRFLENNPDIAHMLDIDLEADDPDSMASDDEAYFANKLFGRIGLLRISEQRRILSEISAEYTSVLRDLERVGINPFKANEYEWKARVVSREVFSGVEQEVYGSVFDEPVYLTRLEWEEEREPIRWERVKEAEVNGISELLRDGRCQPARDRWSAPVDFSKLANIVREQYFVGEGGAGPLLHKSFTKAMEAKFPSITHAMTASDDNSVKRLTLRGRWLQNALQHWLAPGKMFQFREENDRLLKAYMVDMLLPEPGREHLLGQYIVRLAVPGERMFAEVSLSRLYELGMEPANNLDPHSNWSQKAPQAFFDDQAAGIVTCSRLVLDGNLFKAAQIAAERKLGVAGIYTDESGVRQRAIIAWYSVGEEELRDVPLPMERKEVAKAMFRKYSGMSFYTESTSDSKVALRMLMTDNRIELISNGSKTNGGKWFLDEKLIAIVGEFAGGRDSMRAVCPPDKLDAVVDYIYQKGAQFYVSASRKDDAMLFQKALIEVEQSKREAAMRAELDKAAAPAALTV